ncbi:hypothetical protein BSZ32_06390 [Rubritalea profundi]|uniref:Uncharacterized protein n=1 Tax=Rubritalea profundi TaxID=1658618 RepID=A0A2S7TZJ8_9BACT|nr:hypothetical protein BSZ32_06390 [Rubritalea profundi]
MEADIKILTDTIRQTAIISSVNFVPSVANSSLLINPLITPRQPLRAPRPKSKFLAMLERLQRGLRGLTIDAKLCC